MLKKEKWYMYESELELQVYVTHTPVRTETIERHMPVDYKPNGGRKKKGQEYYTLEKYELAEQTKRKSLANSKRNLQGVIQEIFLCLHSHLTPLAT